MAILQIIQPSVNGTYLRAQGWSWRSVACLLIATVPFLTVHFPGSIQFTSSFTCPMCVVHLLFPLSPADQPSLHNRRRRNASRGGEGGHGVHGEGENKKPKQADLFGFKGRLLLMAHTLR